MRSAVLSGALAAALAFAWAGCGTEPPLDVAPDVDLTRFQGKWYEIARLPRITQSDCYGTTAFYTRASDGSLQLVNQCNVGSSTGPLKTVTMSATARDPAVAAKLTLDVGGYAGDYWIVELGSDYEYAVIGHPSRDYLWILSRTPTLDADTMRGVVDRAQGRRFDTSHLEYTPQPPGDERASSDSPVGPVPPPVGTGCSVSPGVGRTDAGSLFALLAAAAAAAIRPPRRGRRTRIRTAR